MPNLSSPDTLATFAALALGLILAAAMVLIERRPRDLSKPRLLPTTPLLFVGVLIAMLAIVHLVNLAGYHTGRG